MKIVLFNIKKEDEKFLEIWKKENIDIEVDSYPFSLSIDKIDLVKGANSVSFSQVKDVDDQIYKKLKEMNIKVISQRSAGVDMHNLSLIDELGISLINVPRYSPRAIAEYVLATAMYFQRNFNTILKRTKEFNFFSDHTILSKEMRSLTVGVLGTGNIGLTSAKLFNSLGVEVLAYDIYENNQAKKIVNYVSLDELYKRSDIITIHVPLTNENYHMIDDEAISKMKKSPILINAARGGIVDAKAVLRGLDSKKLKACAMDVYEDEFNIVGKDLSEKAINDQLIKQIIERDDIMYTPHIAYFTETAVDNLLTFALDETLEFLKTGNSKSLVKIK